MLLTSNAVLAGKFKTSEKIGPFWNTAQDVYKMVIKLSGQLAARI